MDKLQAITQLHEYMFNAVFNANDFFGYACAQGVSIVPEDFDWITEHIQKHGDEGMHAVLAYVQNQQPIKPWCTDKFNEAIQELIVRKQPVRGDIDWDFYYYNDSGPYRVIDK